MSKAFAALREQIMALPASPLYSGGDEADDMCPNCVTPWKCNGPHEPPEKIPVAWEVDRAAVIDLVMAAERV